MTGVALASWVAALLRRVCATGKARPGVWAVWVQIQPGALPYSPAYPSELWSGPALAMFV